MFSTQHHKDITKIQNNQTYLQNQKQNSKFTILTHLQIKQKDRTVFQLDKQSDTANKTSRLKQNTTQL